MQHIHLKDVRGEILSGVLDSELGFEQAVAAGTFCPLGDGSADLGSFLEQLKGIGYTGCATYEQDRLACEYAGARADAERSLAHLQHSGVHTRS